METIYLVIQFYTPSPVAPKHIYQANKYTKYLNSTIFMDSASKDGTIFMDSAYKDGPLTAIL